jgi:hypothetical protein
MVQLDDAAARVRPLAILIVWMVLVCCGRIEAPPPTSPLDGLLRQYIELAVALGERDPDALDYFYGPAEWVAGIRRNPPGLLQIKQSAATTEAKVRDLQRLSESDRLRQRFLAGQLKAIETRVDLLLGVKRSFDDETQAFFGIRLAAPANEGAGAIRSELARLLPGKGTLAQRYAAFDAKFTIPPDRTAGVFAGALQACREQTIAHMQLPPGESVTVEYVNDKPWSAYSSYQGNYHSLIQINAGLGLTVDRALELACHEGYPGHHAVNVLTDEQLVRGRHRSEFLVQPTFSPQSFFSEALATVAADVAFPEPARIRLERETLLPLAGLKGDDAERYVRIERLVDAVHPAVLRIARSYLDGDLEFARAAAALEDQALMVHSEATLRYLNEYRSYVAAYTEGRDLAKSWIESRAGETHWAAYRELIAHPDAFLHLIAPKPPL